jgi:hypothetical protein
MKLSDRQLRIYIDGMLHNCKYYPKEASAHEIKDCKEREKWTISFLIAYKKRRWKPMLYDNSINYDK